MPSVGGVFYPGAVSSAASGRRAPAWGAEVFCCKSGPAAATLLQLSSPGGRRSCTSLRGLRGLQRPDSYVRAAISRVFAVCVPSGEGGIRTHEAV
jgi:hypothetical protein